MTGDQTRPGSQLYVQYLREPEQFQHSHRESIGVHDPDITTLFGKQPFRMHEHPILVESTNATPQQSTDRVVALERRRPDLTQDEVPQGPYVFARRCHARNPAGFCHPTVLTALRARAFRLRRRRREGLHLALPVILVESEGNSLARQRPLIRSSPATRSPASIFMARASRAIMCRLGCDGRSPGSRCRTG
jgi:hypothetical protein